MYGGNCTLPVEITHISPFLTQYSRLDYFFMFCIDRFKIKDCSIKTIDLSDHRPISMSLITGGKIKKNLWRLNSNILNDLKIREKLRGGVTYNPLGHIEGSIER